MPGTGRIIKRGRIEVNASSSFRYDFFAPRDLLQACTSLWLVSALALLSGCGSESKAERLYDKAQEHVENGELEEAVAIYRDVVGRFPQSGAAARAEEQITLYQGLADSVRTFAARTAQDLMIQTSRAVENYRLRHGSLPQSLDRLQPAFLAEPPIDPWGRPLIYRILGRSYVVGCLGSDGEAGGEGDAGDWFVRNGRFVRQAKDAVDP